MVTDNSTTIGIANDSVKQRRSKAMDMRYYWVRDRVRHQGQFHVFWRHGKTNSGDYYSKHHGPKQAPSADATGSTAPTGTRQLLCGALLRSRQQRPSAPEDSDQQRRGCVDPWPAPAWKACAPDLQSRYPGMSHPTAAKKSRLGPLLPRAITTAESHTLPLEHH
jgi:hypothetical protein